MNLLDYPLYGPIVDVFAKDKSFHEIDDELNLEHAGDAGRNAEAFAQPNDLVTFFDNHDNPRIESEGADDMGMKQALSFIFTCRGIPVVYYGDEQYLHNDTRGGSDPYDRNAMTSFGTTDAITLIQYLSALRASHPAIAYGSIQQRWINDDVYIYERRLGADIVLVAINKSKLKDQPITGLLTALPPGKYSDYLQGTMQGANLTVHTSADGSSPAANFTIPHRSVSIWVAADSAGLAIGSITPRVANPGARVTISGAGFGGASGEITFAQGATKKNAKVVRWSDGQITAVVPDLGSGAATLAVQRGSVISDAAPFVVNTGKLIPVNFDISGVPPLASGDVVMLTGNLAELGNWSTTWNGADGPAVIPSAGSALLTVSVPAGAKAEFKFLVLHSDNAVTWEGGANHSYTIPGSGAGAINLKWQN